MTVYSTILQLSLEDVNVIVIKVMPVVRETKVAVAAILG